MNSILNSRGCLRAGRDDDNIIDDSLCPFSIKSFLISYEVKK